MKAAIVGIAGPTLDPAETVLFRACPPAGVILFARNITAPAQLALLVAALRRVLPPEAVLMVDQEGGRVARLRPPHWRAHPPAGEIGALFARAPAAGLRAAWLTGALIGLQCREAGFDVSCAPVLDVRTHGASDVVGDRAYGDTPEAVARLGRAAAQGLLAAGIQPVMKHAPGHGRARVDSHAELPRVEANDLGRDFFPFATNMDLPWAMTAHILYTGLDRERPATLSPLVIGRVIRGSMGFDGVLVSDDLAMGALDQCNGAGDPASRAVAALAAGCDLALFCPGDPAANASVLRACPVIAPRALARMRQARVLALARQRAIDPGRLADLRDASFGAA